VKTTWRRRLARWTLTAVVAVLLATALPVIAMRWVDPWYSAFMLDAALDASRQGKSNYRTDYRWADLEQISPHAAVAVIASEDQLFPFHTGFDFKSIRKAVRYNDVQSTKRKPRMRGASTITQQVAKNLFLWPGRGYVRKGLEAWLTLLIELTWPKERILEVYLNVAQFGDGIYGVERGRDARSRPAEPDPAEGELAVELRRYAARPDPRADARSRRAQLPQRARESHGASQGTEQNSKEEVTRGL
jgi:monofunctional glycosyltransferase